MIIHRQANFAHFNLGGSRAETEEANSINGKQF